MNEITEKEIGCPYCGEIITVLIDCSVSHQNYIEDCQVCCQPIQFDVIVEPGGVTVTALHENE